MSTVWTVAGKLVTIFIYMALGWGLRKGKILSENFCSEIGHFLMIVTLPCLILSTFETDYTTEKLAMAIRIFLVSLLCFAVSIAVAYLTAHLFHIEKGSANSVWVFSAVFPNTVFMGWPVIIAIYGQESLFYATFANIAFSVFVYTFGVWIMKSTGSRAGVPFSVRRDILTPVNICLGIGLFLFLTKLRLPAPVEAAVSGCANLTTPLAMIYVGTILAGTNLKEVIKDRRVYELSLVRLILIPLLVILIGRLFIENDMVYGVLVLMHAMPAAGFCVIYAGEYGNDVILSSKFISVSTLLSIITIPLITLFL